MNEVEQRNRFQEQIVLKITAKIIERYQIFDSNLVKEIALDLYNNGIGLKMLEKKCYYGNLFDLDEIVIYLLYKRICSKKTISFSKYKETFFENYEIKTNPISNKKSSSKIIPYHIPIKKKILINQNISSIPKEL